MAATVWVYPERKFEKLGAVRWQVSWEHVRAEARGKQEIDFDTDIEYRYACYATKEEAVKRAHREVVGLNTAFGAATVTKQIVDWFVEEDRVAEWQDTNETEEVSG